LPPHTRLRIDVLLWLRARSQPRRSGWWGRRTGTALRQPWQRLQRPRAGRRQPERRRNPGTRVLTPTQHRQDRRGFARVSGCSRGLPRAGVTS